MSHRGTLEEWQKRMERSQAFTGSIVEFCAEEGVSKQSFYAWRKRLTGGAPEQNRAAANRERGAQSHRSPHGRPVAFIELEREVPGDDIELVKGDVTVRVRSTFDKAALHRVLEVLDERR
jgi:hypothetical protein